MRPASQKAIEAARAKMIAEVGAEARLTARYTGRAKFSAEVMAALAKVPRHEFVDAECVHRAYANAALSIGHSQTISQPYIVALMTDLLGAGRDSAVLEIGMGSGYQTAVLAELVGHVYAMEIIEPLALQAQARLQRLGYENVSVRIGDGFTGWPEHAPYDAILVAAAATEVPPELVCQLKPGGRLVIPLGPARGPQDLVLVSMSRNGVMRRNTVLPVAFVPFTRRPVSDEELE